jgi:hypothetical protein
MIQASGTCHPQEDFRTARRRENRWHPPLPNILRVNDSAWAAKARESVRRPYFAEATRAQNAEHSRSVFAMRL